MVELLISLTLVSILTAMALVITNTFFSTERVVDTSYGNLNQLLPIGTTFQQYIRSAVAPDPTPTGGQPIPPFGIYQATGAISPTALIKPTSLTFFTNIGTRNTKRIAEVSATTAPTPTAPATAPTKYQLTVTTTLPKAAAQSTCPTSAATTTKKCVFTTTHTARVSFRVDDMTSKTVFTYRSATPTPTDKTVGKLLRAPTTFSTCTATVCNAARVKSVGVNLVVSVNTHVGHSADQETVTYEISSVSQAFNPAVG